MRAGAAAFGNVDHMVLLNGADGMSEMFAKALTMGGTGLGLARQLLTAMNGPAARPADAADPAPVTPLNGTRIPAQDEGSRIG